MIPYLLAIAGGYLIAQSRKQDTFAKGGYMAKGGEIYKIQQKFKYDLQPKWEDEKFQTGGHYYLSFKEAQDVKKKLQGLSSSMEYKVVKVEEKMAKGGKVGTYVMTDDTYVNIFLSRGFYEKRGSMGLRYFEHLPTKVFITYDPKGFQTPVIISTDKTGEETIYEGNSIREVKESLDKLGIVTKKDGVYPTKFK